jgi:hypothetical protein
MQRTGEYRHRWLGLALGAVLSTGVFVLAASAPAAAATKVRVSIGADGIDASWTRYGKSRISLSVGSRDYARFNGWERGYHFDADTGDRDGDLVLTVYNGYTARWVLEDAYWGEPSVVVDPRDNGDLYVTVNSDDGTREFLIANGGLGPVYSGGVIPIERRHHDTYVLDLHLGRDHHYPHHVYGRPPHAGIVHIWHGHEHQPEHGHWDDGHGDHHGNDHGDHHGDDHGDHHDNGHGDHNNDHGQHNDHNDHNDHDGHQHDDR